MVRSRFHSSNLVVEKALRAKCETLNVTLFLGNGFDLGLGLKTSYQDFLRQYLNRKTKVNKVVEKFISRIQQEKDSWGDAELAFGQMDFSSLDTDVESAYRMCIHDFQQSLESYLSDEVARLSISKGQLSAIRDRFAHAIVNIIANTGVDKVFDGMTKVVIDVLTLNYTNTIDRLLDFGGKSLRSRIYFKHNGANIEVEFRNVVHIHGLIGHGEEDSRVLFGVDNPGQVADKNLRLLCEDGGYLLKPQKARIGKLSQYKQGKIILGESDVVILFGLSYGKTDMSWWDVVASNALEDVEGKRKRFNDYHVILCPYSKNPIDVRGIDDEIFLERNETGKFIGSMSGSMPSRLTGVMRERFHVLGYGPFEDLWSGERYFCDPLNLHSIGMRYIDGYDKDPIEDLSCP